MRESVPSRVTVPFERQGQSILAEPEIYRLHALGCATRAEVLYMQVCGDTIGSRAEAVRSLLRPAEGAGQGTYVAELLDELRRRGHDHRRRVPPALAVLSDQQGGRGREAMTRVAEAVRDKDGGAVFAGVGEFFEVLRDAMAGDPSV